MSKTKRQPVVNLMDALAKALATVEPKAVRYCEMCDKWVSAKQTECKACGAPTVKDAR
jgi:rRNA maturation endonuclease Nob1